MGRTGLDLSSPLATFARASKAYMFDPTDQTLDEYAVDAGRASTVAVTSTSNGALTQITKDTTYHIGPQCNDGTYFYGVADNGAGGYDDVWRCPTASDPAVGASWTKVSTDIDAKNIWYLEAADLLLAAANVGGVGDCLYWSDDLGVTWTRCTLGGSPWAPTQATCTFRGWELGQSTTGTYVIPEGVSSGPVGSEPKLCRSTDGKAWTNVLTKAADRSAGVNGNHFHACCHHASYGSGLNGARWIAIGGDGKYNRWHYYSDNDGVTWTTFQPQYNQPVQLIDYGDSRYLLAAADSSHGIYLFDSQTGKTEEVTDLYPDHRDGYGYTFLLAEVGGVYYRCSYTTTGAAAVATIWVSIDREHWTMYHKFAAGTGGPLRYAGQASNGKLVFGYVADGANYYDWWVFAISPAQVASTAALLLEPTTTNQLDTACAQCTAGWRATDGSVVSYPTDDPPFGAKYVRVTGDPADASILLYDTSTPPLPIAFGGADLYFSHSALFKNQFSMNSHVMRFARDGGGYNNETSSLAEKVNSTEKWCQRFYAPSRCEHALATDLTEFSPRFDIEPRYTEGSVWQAVLDMACVQIEQGLSTTWMNPAENSGVRADDEIEWTIDFAAEWTTAIDFRPRNSKAHLDRAYYDGALKDFSICSWKAGTATATLWYDTSTATLKLDYDYDGAHNVTLLTTAALDWQNQWHQFRVVVRAEGSSTKLSLDYGTGVLHYASATPMANLLGQTAATIQNGDATDHSANPTNQLPLLWVDAGLYDSSYSDGGIDIALARPGFSPSQGSGLSIIEL